MALEREGYLERPACRQELHAGLESQVHRAIQAHRWELLVAPKSRGHRAMHGRRKRALWLCLK